MSRINEYLGSEGWADENPTRPSHERMQWKPPQPNPRFDLPGPAEKPELRYLSQQDLDALLDRIKAEEALPPHKKNAARIAALKKQAMEMMKRLESLWVQRQADKLLPRINEVQP
jgi:hypothetical protein